MEFRLGNNELECDMTRRNEPEDHDSETKGNDNTVVKRAKLRATKMTRRHGPSRGAGVPLACMSVRAVASACVCERSRGRACSARMVGTGSGGGVRTVEWKHLDP
jgi:hypothetical protein